MKKIISLILTSAICLSFIPAVFAQNAESYKDFFKKDTIIDINIEIDEADLQDMYDFPTNEEYHSADVTVNGVKVKNAGIRTKGNMTLSSVARSDSDRYSFRIKFDKYVKGQTLLGLDELCLNSGYSDPSYMREYLHYELLREMGMKVAQTAFCNVYINGELSGFYLAVEGLDDTFLEDSFGENYKSGNFYKMEEGASLLYKEDGNYTYADLKSGSDKDLSSFGEFVKNLNGIPDGEKGNTESFLDVDSALIYIASNTVLCNYDSYNNSMKHNYYLYENENGVFTVVPWDFNMSFGGRESNTDVGIDTPFVGGSTEDAPLISKLLAVDEYKEKYYSYIKEIMAWLEKFESRVAELKAVIKPYVENDPSAFYTVEQFENATTLQDEQTEKEQTSKEIQAPEDTGQKKERNKGDFGDGKSIINVALERLENLKAQFDGTAEKSTESSGGFGGFGGFGKGDFGDFNGKQPQMPDNMMPPDGFNPEAMAKDGNGERKEPPKGDFGKGMFDKTSAGDEIRVHVNGHIISFDTAPVIENDTALVGFRAVLEALGAEVEWDGAAQTVTAQKDGTSIVLTINSDTSKVNEKSVSLLAAPKIIGNSTMIPVRFISEQFGMKVKWDGNSKLITITSN